MSDEKGSLQWTEKDGLRFLRATDLQGHALFEGAITTDEDREKIPDGVAERLQAMQKKVKYQLIRFSILPRLHEEKVKMKTRRLPVIAHLFRLD